MDKTFTRRRFLALSLGGIAAIGVSQGLNVLLNRDPMDSYKFFTQGDEDLIKAAAPIVIGLDNDRYAELHAKLMRQLEETILGFSPLVQGEIRAILTVLKLPLFRWFYQLNSPWTEASHEEKTKFFVNLSESTAATVQIVFQNFVSLVCAAFYALPESWPDIGYPGTIDFGGLYE